MYFYIDNENNLIKSSREIECSFLLPITEEEYNAAIIERTQEEVAQ